MQTDAYHLWCARIVTFSLSALAAASVGYWWLKGWPLTTPSAVSVVSMEAAPQGPQTLARMLGGGGATLNPVEAQKTSATRYALMGVLAAHGRGAALIAIDGEAAKPVRVGEAVGETRVLQSVTARQAVLGSSLKDAAPISLDLPLPLP